jgi:hypothetical protein
MPDIEIDLSYDTQDAIPEGVRGLFDEVDGKFVLAGVKGMKTEKDVSNVQEALRKERADHSKIKDDYKPWQSFGKTPEEIQAQLDRIDELEAAADGKLDDDKINGIVEGRLKQKTGPLERQLTTLTEERDTYKTENERLKGQIERRDMNEAVRTVATEMKVVPTAIMDVEMIAASYLERGENGQFIVKADAQGVTPGVDVKQFMKEMQKMRPHWWPQSEGGGAGGGGSFGGGPNPWSADGWNMTEQGKIVREKGMEVAGQMAKSAGTTVGGLRPTKK